ncbi:hypothetical protein LIER_38229 [Lithospermum erythrorhizon]|uniref:Uncharacterized protein n=1 Tax=Lithospermum erythrorhizon TaxID=34254 RepID=A0AAV3Q141_LITER
MLVQAGLVYDKIANIAASAERQLVDFDDMLMDNPSLFTRLAIVTKTKSRDAMIHEATSTSPPPTNSAPTPTINPLRLLHPHLSLPKRPRSLRHHKRRPLKSWLMILWMRSRKHMDFNQPQGWWLLVLRMWTPPTPYLDLIGSFY